ncbi:hypothetical protein SAMN02745248_01707 [Hathewaya proteolytica DSM 3090]|uniref:Uncharacterized protein n=1 Tax=Hathewaya proteolytica DSM 3090 TaxID=1121331 RepID=A0A1M6PHX8_9CLOT|nr:hypothetical protein [Hathewaya proteolytica]SHK07546.1 hypothetical protein SAMN02745248_01707 [Hathewaya proteolytica DSM 3090]
MDTQCKNYKTLYINLTENLKKEVDIINSSDYSKKSLGKFKEAIENLVHINLKNL